MNTTSSPDAPKSILRPLVSADIAWVYALQEDREAAAMAGVPGRFLSEQEFTSNLSAFLERNSNPALAFAIEDGGEAAGYIGCFPAGPEHNRISFWIRREFWGRGLATIALGQLLDALQPSIKELQLEAGVIEGNIASETVLKKCGFKPKRTETFVSAAHEAEKQLTIFVWQPDNI